MSTLVGLRNGGVERQYWSPQLCVCACFGGCGAALVQEGILVLPVMCEAKDYGSWLKGSSPSNGKESMSMVMALQWSAGASRAQWR